MIISLLPTAEAALDDLYRISIGTSLTKFDTTLTINSRVGSLDTSIDLEDTLGLDSETNFSWISGWYRVGDNHRLSMTYSPIRRSTFFSNDIDIVIDNTTIKSGAAISSVVRTDIFDFSYIYSLYNKPQFELGLSAGLYWLKNNVRISAAGSVQAEGETVPVFKSDFFAEQTLQAPMPLFGLTANYEITSSWRVKASARYFALQVSKIEGRVYSIDLGTEYYFSKNWGGGLALSLFGLEVESTNIVTRNSFKLTQEGAFLYAVYKY